MNVLDLFAKLSLDSSDYDKGLEGAKSKAASIGGAISGGLKTMATVGVAAIGAATGAVSAFAGSAIKEGMSFDKAMSQVYATMGDKSDALVQKGVYKGQKASEALRDFAMEMGRTTRYTAEQSAEALNYMALAGYDAATSMQMLPNVMSLAAAGDFDLARASDMLTDSQTAFGISLERTTLMVDEMAKAASTGNTSVEQLGDAFLVVGGLAQELNGGFVTTASGATLATDGIQELEIALTAMANAGVKGSEAGTHMRNMLLKLSDPTDKGTQALERMGVTIFDKTTGAMRSLTDIMGDLQMQLGAMTQEDKIGVISALFNTRDMAAAEALLGAVEQKYVKIGDDLVDMATAYEQYGDAIYDSSQGFEIVQSSWDQIGEQILDSKIKLDDVTQAITDSGFEWEKYGRTAQSSIDKLSGDIRNDLLSANMSVEETAADIADAYDISFSDAMKAVRGVKTAIDETTGSAETMANTQMDNLWGSIEYFKSALSGAKILISNELTPDLRSFVDFGTDGITRIADAFQSGGVTGAMGAFGEVLSEGLNMIIKLLPDAISAGAELLSAIGQGIIDNLPTIVDAAVDIVVMFAQGLVQALPELVNGFITLIEALRTSLSENAEPLLEAGRTLLEYIWNGISTGLPALVTKAYGALPGIISQITEFIKGNGTDFIGAGIELISNLIHGMLDSLPEIISAITELFIQMVFALTDPTNLAQIIVVAGDIIMTLANGILEAIPQLLDAIPQIISNLVGALVASLPEILAVGVQLLVALITGIIQTIPRLVLAIPAIITALVGGLVQGIQAIVDVGHDIVAGLWQGIKERWDGLVEDFKGLASGLIDGVKGLFGISSPSKVFAEMGRYIDEGFAQGINAYSGLVDDAMDGITDVPDINAEANINGSGSNSSNMANNVIINVYGAQGQDEETLARKVANLVRDEVVSIGAT